VHTRKGGRSWRLDIDKEGNCTLDVGGRHGRVETFRITEEQLRGVRQLLEASNFMDLGEGYGRGVPCGSRRVVKVTKGNSEKTVSVNSVEDVRGPNKRMEVKRFLDLFVALRGLFDASDAVDSREYDRRFVP